MEDFVFLCAVAVGIASFILAWLFGPRFVHKDLNSIARDPAAGSTKISRYSSVMLHTNISQANRLGALQIRLLQDQIRNVPQPPVSSFGQKPIRDAQSGLIIGWE